MIICGRLLNAGTKLNCASQKEWIMLDQHSFQEVLQFSSDSEVELVRAGVHTHSTTEHLGLRYFYVVLVLRFVCVANRCFSMIHGNEHSCLRPLTGSCINLVHIEATNYCQMVHLHGDFGFTGLRPYQTHIREPSNRPCVQNWLGVEKGRTRALKGWLTIP